jgi:hypothetical protein
MKKVILLFIILQFLSNYTFSDENDMYNIIHNKIGESIEWKYINRTNLSIFPRTLRYYDENELDVININIYFNAGVYELNNDFNNNIENKLIVELKNIYQNYDVSISTFYPFSILLVNIINYELDERRDILDNIYRNTHGIIIENIFQNSIYGYFEDNYFINLPEAKTRVNKLIYNNFNLFLEVIYRYYGVGNIICY